MTTRRGAATTRWDSEAMRNTAMTPEEAATRVVELTEEVRRAEQRLADCRKARDLLAASDAIVAKLRRQLGVPDRTQHSAELALNEVDRWARTEYEKVRRALEQAERVTH